MRQLILQSTLLLLFGVIGLTGGALIGWSMAESQLRLEQMRDRNFILSTADKPTIEIKP